MLHRDKKKGIWAYNLQRDRYFLGATTNVTSSVAIRIDKNLLRARPNRTDLQRPEVSNKKMIYFEVKYPDCPSLFSPLHIQYTNKPCARLLCPSLTRTSEYIL